MSDPSAAPADDSPHRRNLHQQRPRRRRRSNRLYPTDDDPPTHPSAPNPFFSQRLGAPDCGSYTIGELGSHLHSARSEDDDSLWFYLSQDGVMYPTLDFSDGGRSGSDSDSDGDSDGDDGISLPVPIHSRRPNPLDLLEVDDETTTTTLPTTTPTLTPTVTKWNIFSKCWSFFVGILIWFASWIPCCSCLQMCVSIPPLQTIIEDIQRLSQGPIFASHDALPLIAVCIKKRVFLYDISRKKFGPGLLVHDVGHVGVVKMCWRGRGRKALAVIGRNGVVFWDVGFEFRDGRMCNLGKSASAATSLKVSEATRRVEIQERREGKARIPNDAGGELCRNSRCVVFRVKKGLADCCWAPDGSVLVACSVYDHRLMFWTRRRKWGSKRGWGMSYVSRYNGGIRKVQYSPNGRFLVAVHCQNVFRVWETAFFQNSEKWNVRVGSYVQAFSWTSDSRTLVISAKNDHNITLISFQDAILQEREPRNPNRPEAVKGRVLRRIDLHQFIDRDRFMDSPDRVAGIPLCGSIADIQINPRHSCRMVVAFDHSELLAVFRCDFDDGHPLSLQPAGFIRGIASSNRRQNDQEVDFEEEEGEVSEAVSSVATFGLEDQGNLVHQMDFLPWFRKGALLCVLWKDFSMGFIPFYFALRHQ